MTREECEKAILTKAAEIAEIVKQYEPNNIYLSLCIMHDKCSFNNNYWESATPINAAFTFGGQDD